MTQVTTNGIGPIKSGAFLSVTGIITSGEFFTLNSTPHIILPAIGGAYVVHSFVIGLVFVVRGVSNFGIGYAPLMALSGVSDGSISWLRLSSLPSSGYFSGGPANSPVAANISTGAPLVFMTDVDDGVGQYQNAFYQVYYSITNPTA